MLQRSDVRRNPAGDAYWQDGPPALDLERYIGIIRRRWKLVAFASLISLLFGYAYLVTAVPIYSASTRLLIDTPETQTSQEVSGVSEGFFESGEIDSQVELIRSEAISAQVVDSLDLLNNRFFWSRQRSPGEVVVGWLRSGSGFVATQVENGLDATFSLFGGSADEGGTDQLSSLLATASDNERRREEAIKTLADGLSVARVDRTYVVAIAYRSPYPNLAAEIANGFANAYIDDQLESKYNATRRASEWLLTRTEELRTQAASAEQAVEAFRQANGLVAASGSLISEQQLAEINGRLIAARADVALQRARFERLSEIVDSNDAGAAVAETLSQTITSDLRARYLEASKRFAEISALLGANHAQAVRQRNEMFQLQRLMFEELKRVTEVAGNELQVALNQVSVLEDELETLVGTSNQANETQIQLGELERNATSLRALYTSFLERYQESLQTQSFPISDARIITPAEAPSFPSSPNRIITLTMALFLGAAAGGALSMLLELRDRVFRSGEQIRTGLGLEFIGILPVVSANRATRSSVKRARAGKGKPAGWARKLPLPGATVEPLDDRDPLTAAGEVDELEHDPTPLEVRDMVMNYAAANPLSGFSETLRSAKVAADLTISGASVKTIGIASVLPNEGKTTVSKNLASLTAAQGAKVLLIDADLRNPGLTRSAVGRTVENGLAEVILDGANWRRVIRSEEETGLAILPTNPNRRVPHTSDLLTSPGMRRLLADVQAEYDYVFLDLPPIGPVVDVRAMAPLLDGVVFVVEWGKTDRNLVENALSSDAQLYDKIIGVILNKADKEKLKLYENYQSGGYYYNRYKKYYTS